MKASAALAVAAGLGLSIGLLAPVAHGYTGRARLLRPAARARAARVIERKPPSAGPASPPAGGPAHAPVVSPLDAGTTSSEGDEEPSGRAPAVESDPLVSNGLGSPLCEGALAPGGIPARASRNCSTSGFVASAAPTDNFGLDVHIDTGLLGVSKGGFQSAVQDVLIAPVWTALVWVVHAVCVMLEWCFTLDLLDSSATSGLGASLRSMQGALTEPWLASVLAIACVVVLYDGLVRRRVAETLGEALMMAAMIAAGMWAIADPTGTVGALSQWANQASLGTLAVTARGEPRGAARSLAESMQTVFTSAIEAPWCYLEFGNVAWCRDAAQLDPALRAAALKIAASELSAAGCSRTSSGHPSCVNAGGAQAAAVEHSAELLREARSNGAIFLALPPNGPARNSINEEGSLLRTLCGSSEATNCRGATAAEAEFRTGGGTMPRMTGLVLIAAGALGMILLLSFIGLRLLGAAVFSLLLLLLAPGVVLAPALGEGGRAIFRRWLVRLLGAVVSKLLFSFLLGVVLAVLSILASLQALGWWTQWLLMSAFWWGAFLRRHQALGLAEGVVGERSSRATPIRRSLAGRLNDVLDTRKGWAAARWAYTKTRGREGRQIDGGGEAGTPARRPHGSPPRSPSGGWSSLPGKRDPNPETTAVGDERSARAAREQLGRLQRAQAIAAARGDRRRVAELQSRADRVQETLRSRRPASDARSHRDAAGGERGTSARTHPASRDRASDQRPPRAAPSSLDAPASHDPGRPRAARLEIEREIALREQAGERLDPTPSRGAPRQDGAPEDEQSPARPQSARRPPPPRTPAGESSVMRDAREVAAGRKRQLGKGLP